MTKRISIFFVSIIILSFIFLLFFIDFNKNCKFYESSDYKNIINNFGYFELIKCTDINSKKNIVKNYISKFWFASLLKEIQYLMTSQEKKIFLSNIRNEAEFIIDELQDPPKKIQGLINNQKYKIDSEFLEYNFNYDNWFRSHGGYDNSKYFNSEVLSPKNINKIKLAWTLDYMNEVNLNRWKNNVQLNPIFAEGMLISSTTDNKLIAVDILTGKITWEINFINPIARRGILYWKDSINNLGFIFVNSKERLFKINIKTGEFDKNFGTNGFVFSGNSITSPLVYKNNVWVVTTNRPILIQAFDLNSGENKNTISLNSLDLNGSISWGGNALDPSNGLLFITTGNPKPALYGGTRKGDNFGSNSVVAINLNSKKIEWVFQETKHDLWDYDIGSPPMLTTLKIKNKQYSVVVAPTKIGNTLILDRISGKPIFDINYRKVEASNVFGETTSKYQIDSQLPERFIKLDYHPSDYINTNIKYDEEILNLLNKSIYGFFKPPEIGKKLIIYGLHGGASWPGASIDKVNDIMYIPVNQVPFVILLEGKTEDLVSDYVSNEFKFDDVKKIYIDNCSNCHGIKSNGKFSKKGEKLLFHYPSLTGLSVFKKNIYNNKNLEEIYDSHNIKLSKEKFNKVINFLKLRDNFLHENNKINIYGNWYQLLDKKDMPLTNLDWGYIVSLNLRDGKILWKSPIGEVYKENKKKLGTPIYGGVALTSENVLIATGTDDNNIYFLNAENGKIIKIFNMKYAGSTSPTIYEYNGYTYISIVASGGIYHNFKDKGMSIYTFRIKN